MKYKITKTYNGNVELPYGDKLVTLTDKNNSIILTEQEYKSIPKNKQYLLMDGLVIVDEVIEEEQSEDIIEQEETKEIKKPKK